MAKPIPNSELWPIAEPLLPMPKPHRRDIRGANRSTIAPCSPASYSCCNPAFRGKCCRRQLAAPRA